jgi:hypothetical protein
MALSLEEPPFLGCNTGHTAGDFEVHRTRHLSHRTRSETVPASTVFNRGPHEFTAVLLTPWYTVVYHTGFILNKKA